MRTPVFGISDQTGLYNHRRCLEIKEADRLYYLCSENKGADQLRVFVFAYAKNFFSHDTAHLYAQRLLIGKDFFVHFVSD